MKLTLRERIIFWCKEKVWLKPLSCGIYGDDEISFYEGRKRNTVNRSVWILDSSKTLTKISYSLKKFFGESIKDEEKGWYFFGTEGIFYKKPRETLKTIYWEKDFKGICAFPDLGIVCILRDNYTNDIIVQISEGQFSKIMEGKIVFLNNQRVADWTWMIESKKQLKIIMKKREQYVYHLVDEDGKVHCNLKFSQTLSEIFNKSNEN